LHDASRNQSHGYWPIMRPVIIQLDQVPECWPIHATMSSHACGLTPDAAAGPLNIHDRQVLRIEVASLHIIGPVMCPLSSSWRIHSVITAHELAVGALPVGGA